MEPIEQYDDEDIETTEYSRVINGKTVYYHVVVNDVILPDAPSFPNDSLQSCNCRTPSYSAWYEFCRMTGLYDLFFDDECGLMREHPGFQVLHLDHAVAIQNALNDWKAKHPNAIPGFEKFPWRGEVVPTVGYDYTLARLEWLNWWVQWALKHCENAGIYNF